MQVIMMSKDGCGTCTTFAPVAKQLAQDRGVVFKVIKNPEIELPFFPCYYLMKDGAILEEWGGGSEKKFIRVLDRAIARQQPPQDASDSDS